MQSIYERPVEILQNLVRYDTTNPPGNEAACVQYIAHLLRQAGIEPRLLGRNDDRPNLIARLPGRGDAPPLMLEGHVDVVTTEDQDWEHPPFAAEIVDGTLWGRGTLDDKGSVAMMVAALLRAKAEADKAGAPQLPGDIVLTVVADEEAGAEYGASYLVEQHPEQFEGIRDAIGEGGGLSVRMVGQKCYPISVTEKQICSMQVTLRGPAGHGSMPLRGGAMAKLAEVLHTLDRKRLPVHIMKTTRQMFETLKDTLAFPQNLVLGQLLNPVFTDRILDALGNKSRLLAPMFHNTVSPTIVQGGTKINVIPGMITLHLDGRLLPGFGPEDMLRELRALLENGVELAVTSYEPGPAEPDMKLYQLLAGVLQKADPEGIPLPYMLSGVTDARHFSRLGIQMYGFMPLQVPDGLVDTIHAANERVPVAAVEWGTQVMYEVLQRYGRR
ncbi:MAG: M20/M25/M40 family metallo-hydrolase [Anaerolineae bacterium]|nr:M20/M25/M40 family metallo-hydrolase [Anaerolineae bacterium]